jgi:hypothetical protein
MANTKRVQSGWITGLTLYCIVKREADGYLLNDADGAFAAAPADPYVALSEHATIKGLYTKDEARTAWDDGLYTVAVYSQVGGSPAPASDTLVGLGVLPIDADTEASADLILGAIATGTVWDDLLSDHTTAGTFGRFITNTKSQYGIP